MRIDWSVLSTVLCLSLTVLLPSCAPLQHQPQTTPNKPRAIAIAETVKLAQSQTAVGEYKKALALYAAADDKYEHDATLQHHYARTGDLIRAAADTALQQGVFNQAGGIYRVLLESGITGRGLKEPLSFDASYLHSRISLCSNALMELGLVKYREDDLDGAFSIWNKILAFDPGNKAVTKALQTTVKQRQKLKDIGASAK